MIFKRKIYDKLVEWKNESNGKTALIVFIVPVTLTIPEVSAQEFQIQKNLDCFL